MNLPKLYSPVLIEFWTLRNGIGSGGGVIFDIDTKVTRKCMRVLGGESWLWQIVGYIEIREWDHLAEVDQEILSDCGAEVEFSIVTKRAAT